MEELSSKAFGSLGPFPIIQGIVGLVVITLFAYVVMRAIKDKNGTKPSENFTAPPWLIKEMMDETRLIKQKCDSIEHKCDRTYEKTQETKQLLEFVRNEFHLRKN